MAPRENFFILLDLDPSVDDWAVIEKRIRDKQQQWSRDRTTGNPKQRRKAERNLPLIKDIEAALRDPKTRKEEAKAARTQLDTRRKQVLDELDGAIQTLRGGGRCSDSQLKKLVGTYGKALSADEIKRRIRAAGVRIESADRGEAGDRQAKPRIDDVTAKNIQRNLEHLCVANLYEFLGLRPNASSAVLIDHAEEIYRENQRLGKTDADASAKNELAGICKRLFKDDDQKQRYDNYVAIAAMDGLKENIELAGDDNFISREEMDTLVRQAMERGVSAEDARAFIEEYAEKRRWGVQREGSLPAESLRVCGFCYAVAPAGANACTDCGEALEIECPSCGTKTPTADAACASCGCKTGDAPVVRGLLIEGRRLADDGDLDGARRCFKRALQYWPAWSEAQHALQQLAEQERAQKAELERIEELVNTRHLVAARTACERFERSHGSDAMAAVGERIARGIKTAEEAFRDGELLRRKGDVGAALDRYDEALAACADFEPAQTAMAANPPPAPQQLRATEISGGLRLQWAGGSGSGSVVYRAVRKAGGVPSAPGDGVDLGEIRGSLLDDVGAPVGEALYYAVFSVRGGVVSHGSAHSGPHLRVADVSDLQAVAGDGEVRLSWTTPPGCSRIEVWRKAGKAPKRTGDGQPVVVAGDGAHDSGLDNGVVHGYRVVALFADPARSGEYLSSAGAEVTATPIAPPAVVDDLTCVRKGRTAVLEWTPVAAATVQIRRSSEEPAFPPGTILPVAKADQVGELVASTSGTGAQVQLEGQGRFFFVPVSVAAGTAVVGHPREMTTLDPVANLSSRRSGRRIELTWDWPPGLSEVAVCYSHDRYPTDPRSVGGNQVRVSRREYDRMSAWVLQHAEPRRHYFSVFATVPASGLFSPPAQLVQTMGQAITVSYRLVAKKSFFGRRIEEAWLELRCSDPDYPQLPAVVVVGKQRGVPISPRDGRVFAEENSVLFEAGVGAIPIPYEFLSSGAFVKLFFKEPDRVQDVRLLPAAKDRLKLA